MNDMSLKARIRNMAVEKNISAAAVLQNYLINRFLFRLAKSEYKDKFVIKGGILISSIIGIEQRATMDLDATLRYMKLEEDSIRDAFIKICSIPDDDGIEFKFRSISQIRDDDEYGGYRIAYSAVLGKINAPMSMDISTGDVITPAAQLHEFTDIFDSESKIELLAYPAETVLAEKLETILSRGVENTRPRDFYDVYMLSALDFDSKIFSQAFEATSKHRGSYDKIQDYASIIENIREDRAMNQRWNGYQKQMPYAEKITFDDALDVVQRMVGIL
ncbi:MAG: nucleotidyl transferase AbiEii/AbiGii toxin family protein [Lachnospiraceae bacterium]|nr:nucleotidyl transferase AbiEii/AbiGii toxin family protein [Lachnospiraceae bacterium]